MPSVTRSKRNVDMDMDQLSGLMTGMNLTTKPMKSRTIRVKKEKDIADLFSGLTVGKSIRKTPRRKGARFTHKKTHKTPYPNANANHMELGGSKRHRHRKRKSMYKKRK